MANDTDELAGLPGANVRAATYYIARTRIPCPHCGAVTALTAVALAPGHETLDDDTEEWQSVPANAFLFYLEAVSCTVTARLRRAAPGFCFDSHWLNRCQHCDRTLADQEVHGEPGRGFTPLDAQQAAGILLTEIAEPFEALAGGYTLEPEFFAQMRHG